LEKAIGKGVGKALMQECINKAKELQMKSIWLGVWEQNERAIGFYQHELCKKPNNFLSFLWFR
jgi:ribosomal protein S18 acetylase RimI-like enzyme